MVLARTVLNPQHPDTVLLTAGFVLTTPMIARLHEIGVYDLWIRYPGLDFLDDLFRPELTAHQRRLCENIRTGLVAQASRGDPVALPINECRDTVRELMESLLQAKNMPFMSELSGVDDVLMRHSAEVTYLSLMLGIRLENYLIDQRSRVASARARDLISLGLGCMLHDIGEIKLPEQHRESRVGLLETSREWRQHVLMGYDIVKGQVDPTAANIVLNHHQHFDGSGFPMYNKVEKGPANHVGQTGTSIHIFSRITAAADTLIHLLHADGHNMPNVIALHRIQQKPFTDWLDPVILKMLLAVVPPFTPGTVVKLTDGRDAVVTAYHEALPCYPIIQILGQVDRTDPKRRDTVNLAYEPKLAIQSVDGFDVTAYLFGQRIETATVPI